MKAAQGSQHAAGVLAVQWSPEFSAKLGKLGVTCEPDPGYFAFQGPSKSPEFPTGMWYVIGLGDAADARDDRMELFNLSIPIGLPSWTPDRHEFAKEPRVRHSTRCDEAQPVGGKRTCICSEWERLHEDFVALKQGYVFTTRYGDVNPASLASAARAKAALDDLHARIEAAIEIEGGTTGCPVCRAEGE